MNSENSLTNNLALIDYYLKIVKTQVHDEAVKQTDEEITEILLDVIANNLCSIIYTTRSCVSLLEVCSKITEDESVIQLVSENNPTLNTVLKTLDKVSDSVHKLVMLRDEPERESEHYEKID